MSRILLGVSGGIAAYKALEFVRLASGAGHSVRVVQTPTSERFVGRASFEALTGAAVLVSEFERDPARGAFPGESPPEHDPLSHLELVARADAYLIAPASANTIAKLAAGIADGLLTTCALAARCPLLIAPAMNNHMWEHPATVANVELLASRGAVVIEPGVGPLASRGEHGSGRLAEPAELLAACERALAAEADMSGLRVLVTAGGTREAIDSVRYIGNSSSGRMGFELARAARERGAEVTLLAANAALSTPSGVRRVDVVSAGELAGACASEFPGCDVLLMAAAVADFTPSAPADGKIKKAGRERMDIALEPTEDILAALSRSRSPQQTLVGFAAEHGAQAAEDAVHKLAAKGLDALVVNDISRSDIGFDVDSNEVTILSAGRDAPLARRHVPRSSKRLVAHAVLDTVVELRRGG